jgi:hypothetical protein
MKIRNYFFWVETGHKTPLCIVGGGGDEDDELFQLFACR